MKKSYFFVLKLIFIVILGLFFEKAFKKIENKSLEQNQVSQNSQNKLSESQGQEQVKNTNSAIFLDLSSPKDKSIVNNQTITISGKTVPMAEVFINDLDLKADKNGNFTLNLSLDEGENTINIVANDENGNSAEKEVVVNYEQANINL